MTVPHDPQMLKGVLSLLLLSLVAEREDYGYSLALRLHDQGFEGLGEGTVYPALSRLEGNGLLGSHLVPSPSGPARKYYTLTAAGHAELDRGSRAWNSLVDSVRRVLAVAGAGADNPASSGTHAERTQE